MVSRMQSAMQGFQPLHDAVIRVYDETGNVIKTHEQADDFNQP
jgi:hypothetical protein